MQCASDCCKRACRSCAYHLRCACRLQPLTDLLDFRRGFATQSQVGQQHAETSAQGRAREEHEQRRLQARKKAAKQGARLNNLALPAYFAKRWDTAPVNPARALERLSTLPLTSPSKTFLDPDGPLLLEGTEAGDRAEAERVRHNNAVHQLHVGIQYHDWERAFKAGWTPLFETGQQDRLDMLTTERLVSLLGRQPDMYAAMHWPQLVKTLFVPIARREVGSEVASSVGQYLAKLAQRNASDLEWQKRVSSFWETFVGDARDRGLAGHFGHPHGLLQVPANLFTAILISSYRAAQLGHPMGKEGKQGLSGFLQSCQGVIAVPPRFGVAGASEQANLHAQDITVDTTHEANLKFWFGQCELFRTWQRAGEAGLRYANHQWRSRRNERAAELVWQRIKQVMVKNNSSDCWWEIDWRDELYRNREKQASGSGVADLLDLPTDESTTAGDAKKVEPQQLTLPAQFTPAVISEFIHTFLHLNMPEMADEVWNFCRTELNLAPTLIMWNARLLGYSALRQSAEVERVFMQMEMQAGIRADAVSWSILINSYFRSGKAQSGLDRMQQMLANKALRDRQPDGKFPVRVYNIMLNALLWDDSKEAADHFLQNMISDDEDAPGADIYTVNILLRYYSRARTFDLARISDTIGLIERFQLAPDHYTFTTILDALLRAGRPDAVDRIQLIMKGMGVQANAATYGAMIHHLVKTSHHAQDDASLQAALALLRKMQEVQTSPEGEETIQPTAKPSEIIYTSLVQGFARWAASHESTKHLLLAEQLHSEMLSLHIPPNRITYNSLMTASLAAGDIAKAMLYFRSHRDMKRRRTSSTPASLISSSNARVEADGSIEDETVLMSEKISPRTWQALIAGLIKYKHWSEAKMILEEMKAAGVSLNSPSFAKMVKQVEEKSRSRAM